MSDAQKIFEVHTFNTWIGTDLDRPLACTEFLYNAWFVPVHTSAYRRSGSRHCRTHKGETLVEMAQSHAEWKACMLLEEIQQHASSSNSTKRSLHMSGGGRGPFDSTSTSLSQADSSAPFLLLHSIAWPNLVSWALCQNQKYTQAQNRKPFPTAILRWQLMIIQSLMVYRTRNSSLLCSKHDSSFWTRANRTAQRCLAWQPCMPSLATCLTSSWSTLYNAHTARSGLAAAQTTTARTIART